MKLSRVDDFSTKQTSFISIFLINFMRCMKSGMIHILFDVFPHSYFYWEALKKEGWSGDSHCMKQGEKSRTVGANREKIRLK